MFVVLRNSWALLFGVFLLMLGNGLQGNLLAYRGNVEGFDPFMMSLIMSAYFLGFFIGANITTKLIKNVGHVRVFAAFASMISAAFVLFPLIPNEWVWIFNRLVIGISFAGVYIVTESWLNSASENSLRGKVISLYVFVQMAGILAAQILINFFDVGGYELFVIMSILVSVSFAPILLSTEKAPVFETAESMSLRELYKSSPLGYVSILLVGGIFALQFAMIGVYTGLLGFDLRVASMVTIAIYLGGLFAQYPIGWLSDRMDRRLVIIGICIIAAVLLGAGMIFNENISVIIAMGAVMGAVSNPLYSVSVAYINDRVPYDKMAGASSAVMLLNGLGAVGAPVFAGYIMQNFGANMFWVMQITLFAALAAFGLYRSTVRDAVEQDDTVAYTNFAPVASPVMMEVTQEYVAEQYEETHDEEEIDQKGSDEESE